MVHQLYPASQPFSVAGLVFGVDSVRGNSPYKVWDFHTKAVRWVCAFPNRIGRPCAIGMVVDSSVEPYTFKVIYGSVHDQTQIYDSETQSVKAKPSLVLAGVLAGFSPTTGK
jgi:hypothetical protein